MVKAALTRYGINGRGSLSPIRYSRVKAHLFWEKGLCLGMRLNNEGVIVKRAEIKQVKI